MTCARECHRHGHFDHQLHQTGHEPPCGSEDEATCIVLGNCKFCDHAEGRRTPPAQPRVSLYSSITCEVSLLQVNRVDATSSKGGDVGEEAEPLRGREGDEEGSRRGSLEDLQRAASPTMLLSMGSEHEGYDTRYAKSFIHFTREALPRLDNYRNILSVQAAYRPTLEELHNATLHLKVGACFIAQTFWNFALISPLMCTSIL